MKKITCLLSVFLLSGLGALAQKDTQISLSEAGLQPSKVYTISGVRGGWYASPAQFKSTNDAGLGVVADGTDVNQQFAFVTNPSDPNAVYLYNVGQRRFIKKDRTLSTIPTDPLYIYSTGDATRPLFFSFSTTVNQANINLGGSKQLLVDSWSTYDDGNKNAAVEVADAEYDLAHVQALFTTQSLTALDQVQANKVYTISTAARGSWYVNADAEYVNSTGKSGITIANAGDVCRFAFIPDGEGGYYLYSVAAQKFLVIKGNHVGLADYPDATSGVTFQASSGSTACPVVVTLNGTRQVGVSNGFNPGVISHYNDLSDGGNQASVVEVPDYTFDNTVAVGKQKDAYMVLVETEVSPFYETAGTGYFCLTDAGKNALEAAGYSPSVITYTKAQYEAMKAVITNWAYINVPVNGWYRLKSTGSRHGAVSYIAAGGNYYQRGTDGYALKTISDKNDLSTYIEFVKVEGVADPTYKLNCAGRGIGTPLTVSGSNYNQPFELTAEPGEGNDYQFAVLPKHPGYVTILDKTLGGTQGLLHEAGWSEDVNAVVRWESDGSLNASAWMVEDVTPLELGLKATADANYASLYLPYGVSLSASVEAYTATYNADESALVMQSIGSEVPALTPVVLKGDVASLELELNTAVAAATGENVLQGTLKPMTWEENYLSLGKSDDVAGFYKWDGTELAANRAYVVPTSSGVKGLAFTFGEATGLSSVEVAQDAPKAIYNLAGQRVQKIEKGVYIVNGKKTIY